MWAITFGYFIVAVGVLSLLVWTITLGAVAAGVVGLVIALPVLLGIVFYCEGYSPQRLEVSQSRITILRRYDSVTILRSTVLDITPISRKDMSWTIAQGGCGGLFGYFGNFSNRRLGHFTMYATSFDNLCLIRTADGRRVVINCEIDEKKLR